MARHDAWPNPEGPGGLREVQADLLRDLDTRVVMPPGPVAPAPRPAARPDPVLTLAGEPVVMVTQFLWAVPASLLRGRPVSHGGEAAAIGDALDLLPTRV